jgi:AAA+ ATPase superfamily predicted ATPase
MKKEFIAPFKVGGEVEARYFIGREKELKQLTYDAFGLVQSNVIIAPRRYGKTWLLQRVEQIVEQESDIIMPYINCLGMNNPLEFNEIIVTNILSAYESKFRTKGMVFLFNLLFKEKPKEILKRIRKISISLGDLGEMVIEFHDKQEEGTKILRGYL